MPYLDIIFVDLQVLEWLAFLGTVHPSIRSDGAKIDGTGRNKTNGTGRC
jgi:hypothetical protein